MDELRSMFEKLNSEIEKLNGEINSLKNENELLSGKLDILSQQISSNSSSFNSSNNSDENINDLLHESGNISPRNYLFSKLFNNRRKRSLSDLKFVNDRSKHKGHLRRKSENDKKNKHNIKNVTPSEISGNTPNYDNNIRRNSSDNIFMLASLNNKQTFINDENDKIENNKIYNMVELALLDIKYKEYLVFDNLNTPFVVPFDKDFFKYIGAICKHIKEDNNIIHQSNILQIISDDYFMTKCINKNHIYFVTQIYGGNTYKVIVEISNSNYDKSKIDDSIVINLDNYISI